MRKAHVVRGTAAPSFNNVDRLAVVDRNEESHKGRIHRIAPDGRALTTAIDLSLSYATGAVFDSQRRGEGQQLGLGGGSRTLDFGGGGRWSPEGLGAGSGLEHAQNHALLLRVQGVEEVDQQAILRG